MSTRQRILNSDLDIKIRMGDLIINILNINYEPPTDFWHISNHCHSSYELHFIPSGKGTLYVQKRTYEIIPGTFYLTGPGIYHEQKSDVNDPMAEYCLNFELCIADKKSVRKGSHINSELCEITKTLLDTYFWFGSDMYDTSRIFSLIMSELENQWLGYYTNLHNLICQIIINAVRCYTNQRKTSFRIPKRIPDDNRRLIIDSYLREYDKKLTALELAGRLGVSTRQLDRIMIDYYDMPFKKKLVKTRLEQAKHLLTHTMLLIDEISERTGFSTTSYFCKMFKKNEGLTPDSYRQNKET